MNPTESNKARFFLSDDDKRKIDDPGLNQDSSTYDKDEDFDDTDDFHKYDDTTDKRQED